MLQVLLLATLARLSTGTFYPELHAKYLQLPRDEFIQYFNSQNYSWKITHHPHLDADSIACVQELPHPIPSIKQIHHDPSTYADLPEHFDARENWPDCVTIKEIYDQGTCGSCWTFGTATVLSDRMCIHKGLTIRLSEQDFTCLFGIICWGGIPEYAFAAWMVFGLVSQECSPYNITAGFYGNCTNVCKDPTIDYMKDKHTGVSINSIANDENEIKAELVKNGPIQAVFTVYQDFMHYSSGIYEHKYGKEMSGHSVRLIGYGVENGVDYWLVANSWGPQFGEKGLFRIKRFQSLLGFESRLLAGIPRN